MTDIVYDFRLVDQAKTFQEEVKKLPFVRYTNRFLAHSHKQVVKIYSETDFSQEQFDILNKLYFKFKN